MKKILLAVTMVMSVGSVNAQWSELGATNTLSASSTIYSICSDAAGNIYATGNFKNDSNSRYIAKYNGTIWNELGGINTLSANSTLFSVFSDAFGNIYTGGFNKNANGNEYVAKYDGSIWSEVGGTNASSVNWNILSICNDPAGNIYIAGDFTNSSGNSYVAKYDGSIWSELGGTNAMSVNNNILSICSDAAGNIYAAGGFTNTSGKNYVAKYNGSTWSELGGTNALSANSAIESICSDAAGNIYAAGDFTNNQFKRYVAKWNGSYWQELSGPGGLIAGTGTLAANNIIWSICSDASNNIYATGRFTNTIGKNYVAKYDGSIWSELGGLNNLSANNDILYVCSDVAGNIYAAGEFTNDSGKYYVAKYTQPHPTLSGYIYTDDNSNSIKDGNDTYKANVKVQLSNGNYTFTDNNGYYQIQADSIGAYTLTVTAPNLYNAVPQTINYNFSSWDTVVTKDIALQPTLVKDSVAINVIPMVMNAVQGAAMPYWIQYNNAGTTVLSPVVNLTYNNYLLGYDSCTDVNAAPTANGIVTGELNMQPGKQNNLISYFTIKPSANIGDTLTTVYNISTTNIAQTDSFYMIIEGGVAASDGQRATSSLTDAQVAAGKEIIYTIGFKNTGSDTAYNVVITDTLSNLLKANTLQMVASSHTCKTTVKGNVVTFELLNIKLPKASSNAAKSIGFVSFKIKPQSNLTAGTIITNKANTYYNYRAPQSSTATTIIKAVVTPLRMLMFAAVYQPTPNPSKEGNVLLQWQTANEVNVSHFNIQRSINNKNFINIGKVSANNNAYNEYGFTDDIRNVEPGIRNLYYRIESVDKDGRKQYSEIRNVELGIRNGVISIYPNPAKDAVTVECKGAKEIQIIDYLGRIIIDKKVINNQSTTINVQGFLKGVYVVRMVMNNNTTLFEKFIKQ